LAFDLASSRLAPARAHRLNVSYNDVSGLTQFCHQNLHHAKRLCLLHAKNAKAFLPHHPNVIGRVVSEWFPSLLTISFSGEATSFLAKGWVDFPQFEQTYVIPKGWVLPLSLSYGISLKPLAKY